MSNLVRWNRLARDRATLVALTAVEMEVARENGDLERFTVADRYHSEAKRMHAAAERKQAEYA